MHPPVGIIGLQQENAEEQCSKSNGGGAGVVGNEMLNFLLNHCALGVQALQASLRLNYHFVYPNKGSLEAISQDPPLGFLERPLPGALHSEPPQAAAQLSLLTQQDLYFLDNVFFFFFFRLFTFHFHGL